MLLTESVTHAVDSENVAGLAGIGLDLAAQVLDMGIDGPVVAGVSHVIDQVYELRPGEGAAGVAGQNGQQIELGGGEGYRFSTEGHAAVG